MDSRRLGALWRAGVAAQVCAVFATTLAWSAPELIGWWAIGVEAVLVVVASVVWVRTRPRPFFGPEWRTYSDSERNAAAKQLLRRQPVCPPALQDEGLDAARRGLWSIGAQGLVAAVMTLALVLQRDSPFTGLVLAIFGTIWLVGGLAAVVYLGTRRRRLDALSDLV